MTMFWRSAPSWELRRSCSRKPMRDRGIALSQTPQLAARLAAAVSHLSHFFTDIGTIADISDRWFASILNIDVLEHLEADHQEVAMVAKLLRPQRHLIVLSPAYQFLFTEFDAAIGHYRPYNKAALRLHASRVSPLARGNLLPRLCWHVGFSGQPDAASAEHSYRGSDKSATPT